MYLRAAKADAEEAGIETDGMANSVSELRETIKTLTHDKVDIMSDEAGTKFKSTTQIMREIQLQRSSRIGRPLKTSSSRLKTQLARLMPRTQNILILSKVNLHSSKHNSSPQAQAFLTLVL